MVHSVRDGIRREDFHPDDPAGGAPSRDRQVYLRND